MSHTALHELGAHELLAGYRARTFSPLDVAQAVLAQIERWEPHIAATWLLRPELALAQARTSEARWARGEPCGALDGVPITDYVVERGSDKHIAYAASKATLDNMTRSFARKLAPEIKVNAIDKI
mgnify:CR=1 FL=1